MANAAAVCLISALLFCCANVSLARQAPKECSKGPTYWCESLRQGADCGAVGHCIATLWEKENVQITSNKVSDTFVRLFKQLKDVKELINLEYLGTRVSSACRTVPYSDAAKICKENTAQLDQYLYKLLTSETSPETMCRVIGMCNNEKLNNVLANIKNQTEVLKPKDTLLGSAHCTWGPSYWCSNFSTGRECHSTKHCVTRVWSKMHFPEDNDDICKICTDMVQQARDQLQSNETQEELKEVFEGSCKLIPIKIVAKECIKLADDFVPELVETLASQMNPQQVCSVAGLCNNARIDKLLEEYKNEVKKREGCDQCHRTVGVMRKKFDATTYEDFLAGLLTACGNLGSLSDSCSMLVFQYYENILEFTRTDLTPKSLCHLSGQCVQQFHTHSEFTFPEESLDALEPTDDVPCEFCEKLVVHLRDVLVANTTEMEFERVLKGLCKQTGKFKDECLHLADQYYETVYNFLVSDLKPNQICSMIGICKTTGDTGVPIAPLLPKELAVKVAAISSERIGAETTPKIGRVPIAKQTNVRVIQETETMPPLPIERMFVNAPRPEGKQVCSFCQYFLHYLQVELSDTTNEEKIKEEVEHACDKLPNSVNGECKQFVTEYGPAVIALLVQEIDPSSVCPALGLCEKTSEVKRVTINSDKSNCPLCLFAVEQLETMLKNNRSEESIRQALDSLCTHLSAKLRTQCVDFVDTYTNQLVDMLVADMNAQEICVFLKLCKDETTTSNPMKLGNTGIDKYHEKPELRGDRNNFRKKSLLPKHMLADIETNEIPDHTVNGRPVVPQGQKTICVICEFVMKEIDDEIKDKHNEDEIKKIVHGVCKRMPKSVKTECDQFVEKYADLVISLLSQELDPAEVCRELKLCDPTVNLSAVRGEILDCAVCETVVMAVKKVLNNDKVDRDVEHVLEKSCGLLPSKYSARCRTMMEIYGTSVIHLIEDYGAKDVCHMIGLCSARDATYVSVQAKRHQRN